MVPCAWAVLIKMSFYPTNSDEIIRMKHGAPLWGADYQEIVTRQVSECKGKR